MDLETVSYTLAIRAKGKKVRSLSYCSDLESKVFYKVDSGLSNKEA
jgi:hypothetical protein